MSGKHRAAVSLRTRMIFIGAIGAAFLLIGGLAASAALLPSATGATITSDKADYKPGSTVTLTGAAWASNEQVHIVVNDSIGQTWKLESGINGAAQDPVADGSGGFTYAFSLPTQFISDYDVTATGPVSGTATTTFTDGGAVLSQCQNGGVGDPLEPCEGGSPPDGGAGPHGFKNYEPGNVNGGKGHWGEGEFLPYRTILSGVASGTHTLDIRYDTVNNNKHALDYLGSFDTTETTSLTATAFHYNQNNPCFDIDLGTGTCTPSSPTDTRQIPAPIITNCGGSSGTGPSLTNATMGSIAIFGRTNTDITDVQYLAENHDAGGGSCDTSVRISFTTPAGAPAGGDNLVVSWSAHIASRADWGNGNSASAINGSPFHMHLDKFDGASTGSQDRQLATNAIFFQPSLVTHVHNAAHQDITGGQVLVGAPVHDTATLSNTSQNLQGNPNAAGTVTYTLFKNGTCTAGTNNINVISTQDVTVTDSVVPDSNVFSPQSAGSYSYLAVYSGDEPQGQNLGATAACEPFTVITATPTVSTQIHQEPDPATGTPTDVQGTTIPLGSTIHDSATVSASGGGATPTGTVTFTFYKNTKTCAPGTNNANVVGSNTVNLSSGVAHPSASRGPLAAGDYSFATHYNSQAPYVDADGPCEWVTVGPGTPTIGTTIHDANDAKIDEGSSIALGSVVHDTAQVGGSVGSFTPTGAVTFTFYTTANCGTGSAIATAGSPDAGNGDPRSIDTSALAVGHYGFKATVAADANFSSKTSACEPFDVKKAQLTIGTKIHNASHGQIQENTSIALGSVVHDTAQVGGTVGSFSPGAVTFTFYTGTNCASGTAIAKAATNDPSSGDPRSIDTSALAAGDYGFKASVAGNSNYYGATSSCEPFSVSKKQLTIGTKIHNSNHNVIPDGSVVPLTNNIVHDTAQVGGKVGTFATGAVTFTFYSGANCTNGTAIATANAVDSSSGDPRSVDTSALPVGQYGFKATVASNSNYDGATSACEPFSVASIGKTMGYWGNKNGIARIQANGGYAANSVTLGRGAVIDTKDEALKVLPNTLNACGKGSPIIFSDQTATHDCSVATGINKNSLNTLAAQTLALGYNIKILPSFSGQTLASLACTQYATAGLTGSSTVNQTFTAAVALINGSASGGTTTQTQIGAMNQLLGCVNREL